ncbi:MAG: efflux RND transporter periplasmic adaptor subunit [Spirochaetaceae bacterium]|nr:MAG: efflux RND transporter periplasmic adaptor subunit [Spirochaetaceae bacterium]
MEDRMNKKRFAVPVILVVLIAGAVTAGALRQYAITDNKDSEATKEYSIIEVQSGAVRVGIESPAVIEPYRQRVFRAQSAAQLSFVAQQGAEVEEGRVLIRFDATDAESKLARAELELEEAQLSLVRSEGALAKAQSALENAEALFAAGALTGEQLANAQDARDSSEYQLQMSEISLRKSRLNLEAAQAELGATVVRAPFTGRVLSTEAESGSQVSSNSTILTFADTSRVRLVAEIDEYDIGGISFNQRAEARVDALGGTSGDIPVFVGRVESISPAARIVSNISVFTVTGVFDNPDQRMRPGMTGDLSVIVAQDRGLVVPAATISTVRDRSYIDVLNENDEIESRRVETGANDGVHVVVLEGLGEDDRVVSYRTASVDILAAPAAPANDTNGSIIPISVPGSSGGSAPPAGSAGGGGGGGGGR